MIKNLQTWTCTSLISKSSGNESTLFIIRLCWYILSLERMKEKILPNLKAALSCWRTRYDKLRTITHIVSRKSRNTNSVLGVSGKLKQRKEHTYENALHYSEAVCVKIAGKGYLLALSDVVHPKSNWPRTVKAMVNHIRRWINYSSITTPQHHRLKCDPTKTNLFTFCRTDAHREGQIYTFG